VKITAIGDKVCVRLEADQTHGIDPGAGGLIETPDAYTYHACRGTVIAVGPGVQKWSRTSKAHYWVRPDVKVGERVFVPPDFGVQVFYDGVEHRWGPEPELQCVVEVG